MLINQGLPFHIREHTAVGLSRQQTYDAARLGIIRRVLHGVYVDELAADTRALRVAAIRAVAPHNAVVSDEWAAWVYGVDVFSPSQRHHMRPTVLTEHGVTRARDSLVRSRQAKISTDDLHGQDGVLLTTPVRTTSDLLRKRWRPHALAAADAMARAGLVTPEEVQEYLATLKGYPGIRQARNLAVWIEPLSASPGESWTRLRMLDAGFARPTAQWHVIDVDGTERWIDLGYPALRLGAEFDGREFHTSDDDRARDDYRRRALAAVGVRIVVVTYSDLFGDNASFEKQIGELIGHAPLSRWW